MSHAWCFFAIPSHRNLSLASLLLPAEGPKAGTREKENKAGKLSHLQICNPTSI